jgi:hypothetical protein
MSERILSAPPSQEELNASYMGLSFNDFCKLTDEEIEELHLAALREESPTDIKDDDFKALSEILTFNRFILWRKYGIPDRVVSAEEINIRLADYVNQRTAKDENYGLFPIELYNQLTDQQCNLIWLLFDYLKNMRDIFEYYIIDDYSLNYSLGMTEAEVSFLVQRGILVKVKEDPRVGKMYELAGQYYDFLLSSHYIGNGKDEGLTP